jgi:hypothetical protein
MQAQRSVYAQLLRITPLLIKLYTPAFAVLLTIALLKAIKGVDVGNFIRDPVQLSGLHPFTGLVSNIGILLWCSTAAICLFCWLMLRGNGEHSRRDSFLLCSGLITAFLLIDDFFLFHEIIFPVYVHVPQDLVYIAYAMLIFVFLIAFRKIILQTDYIILFIAFACFGASMLLDTIKVGLFGRYFFEEAFKFLGICGWAGYFMRVCSQYLKPEIFSPKLEPGGRSWVS